MDSLIPLPYYTPIFYNVILIVVGLSFLKLRTTGYIIQAPNKKEHLSIALLSLVALYMGLRPISGRYFVDMATYNMTFENYQNGQEIGYTRDVLWSIFMKFCSSIMTAKIFFLTCAMLYIVPLYVACKKWLGEDRYFLFLMLVASFSFWAYGVNGIRNGIATSIFVLGLSCYKNKYWQYGIIALSYSIHGSMIIPIAAYMLTLFYKNPKHYLMGWFVCIPISLVLGGAIESLFASLGFADERINYLTSTEFKDSFSSTGFRWDFLVYSATALFAGYYFIVKKNFNDKVYIQLFNIYVIANAFWVLVIRASFSNRFAYLSWFLMAIVIFYPFFKKQFIRNQQTILAYVVLAYFGFTYFMYFFYN